jgi:radical SAM superfamily enzyme YgiQ (UPF0313 family)
MKKMCLITFDVIRQGEPTIAYSAASLLSFLKSRPEYGSGYEVDHFPFNVSFNAGQVIPWESQNIPFDSYDFIGVSCYIWAHNQALDLMQWLKTNQCKAQIIAGGYQVNIRDLDYLKGLYPDADIFVEGFAEEALYRIVTGKTNSALVTAEVIFSQLSSPLLDNTIRLDSDVSKLRMETKRGCPFSCTFCAQHDIRQSKTKYHIPEKLIKELDFLRDKGISRVSVADPVFNMKDSYHAYLEAIREFKMNGVFNFQVRPELISLKNDIRFVELLAATESEAELGIQTFDPEVNAIIKRGNHYSQIEEALDLLIAHKVQFGVSLIYGLPGQTLASFANDLEIVTKLGIPNVVAYPLMILPGTEMYRNREKFGLIEGKIDGDFGIPHVIASKTFSEFEWRIMHEMASNLNPTERLF